jgi:hypothetical protein
MNSSIHRAPADLGRWVSFFELRRQYRMKAPFISAGLGFICFVLGSAIILFAHGGTAKTFLHLVERWRWQERYSWCRYHCLRGWRQLAKTVTARSCGRETQQLVGRSAAPRTL